MKYAIKNSFKIEATPGATGQCVCCGSEMVAKCGSQTVWHWAHKSKRYCDHWWEHETQWHRDWKNHFPQDWQEVVHFADDGEKHIADVKTSDELVIEFQHSKLCSEERTARERFYENMIWVVDGLRLKSDVKKFQRAPTLTHLQYPVLLSECVPLSIFPSFWDWSTSSKPVFFDWGNSLFCFLPGFEPSENKYRPRYRLMFSLKRDQFLKMCERAASFNFNFEQALRAEPNFEYRRIS